MKKFVLRHWRGNGQVIPDVMKDKNICPYSLADCIVQVISEKEYLKFILTDTVLKNIIRLF